MVHPFVFLNTMNFPQTIQDTWTQLGRKIQNTSQVLQLGLFWQVLHLYSGGNWLLAQNIVPKVMFSFA